MALQSTRIIIKDLIYEMYQQLLLHNCIEGITTVECIDQELLDEAKKMKSASLMNAAFIGIMIGVVIYSVAKNTLGFFTLIPLFFAYKLIKNSKSNKPLEEELKARNLK